MTELLHSLTRIAAIAHGLWGKEAGVGREYPLHRIYHSTLYSDRQTRDFDYDYDIMRQKNVQV